jgi:hypothetical protein
MCSLPGNALPPFRGRADSASQGIVRPFNSSALHTPGGRPAAGCGMGIFPTMICKKINDSVNALVKSPRPEMKKFPKIPALLPICFKSEALSDII